MGRAGLCQTVTRVSSCYRLPQTSSRAFSLFASSSASSGSGTKDEAEGIRRYHERKILPYSQEQLYAIVADVDEYKSFVPLCTASRVTASRPPASSGKPWLTSDGEHRLRAELKIGFMGLHEAYTSEVECQRPHLVKATALPTKLFKHLSTTWSFSPASPASPHPEATGTPPLQEQAAQHPTLVSIDLAYGFADPFQQALASAAFDRISTKIMGAFEARCLALYGPGKR